MEPPTETSRKNFNGLRVGSLESRKQAEMTRLIENLGGKPLVVSSIKEVPLEENKEAFAFGEKLFAGKIEMLILFTGVGTRLLFQSLLLKYSLDDLKKALGKITVVARGPKPIRVLTEYDLKPTIAVPEPNTWREILKTLDQKVSLEGSRVAVQEYGETHRIFFNELMVRGAQVFPVPVYRAAFPDDVEPLKNLIQKTIKGEMDVLLFTNATQVEHVVFLARQMGCAQEFRRALYRVVVASVGPTCSDSLKGFGLPVDVEPERPMMGALVAAAAEISPLLVQKKRQNVLKVEFVPTGLVKPGDPAHSSLFMKACRREPVSRTPVWLMRQAGRYMKEYRELRAKVSFIELCKNSDLAAEVTVDAAHRLGVDAAIIFSDILLLVEPMGFELHYGNDQGPEIGNPFRSEDDLKRIRPVDLESSMSFVLEALRKTRGALRSEIPLIGFAGAPFTVASYLIEGKGSKNFIETKMLMYKAPEVWHKFLQKIVEATLPYVNEQINAGAQAIQLFDSWVGCLSPEDFRTYVLPHTRYLIQKIVPGVPVISFGTQTAGLLPLFKQAGGDVIGLDWRVELDEAWDILGEVAIQGNLDPVVLLSNPAQIRTKVERILNQASGRTGHIFNLGHGVLPETPIENVLALVEAVKTHHSAPRT